MALSEAEIVEAMQAGEAALADDPAIWPELDDETIAAALEQAADVTASRAEAWRRRHREMTWLELRVLLVGLRASV